MRDWRIQLRRHASRPACYTSHHPWKANGEKHVGISWTKILVSRSLDEPLSMPSRPCHQDNRRTRLILCWVFPAYVKIVFAFSICVLGVWLNVSAVTLLASNIDSSSMTLFIFLEYSHSIMVHCCGRCNQLESYTFLYSICLLRWPCTLVCTWRQACSIFLPHSNGLK